MQCTFQHTHAAHAKMAATKMVLFDGLGTRLNYLQIAPLIHRVGCKNTLAPSFKGELG